MNWLTEEKRREQARSKEKGLEVSGQTKQ